MENKHPAWLDDKTVVTKGFKQQHMDELIDVLLKCLLQGRLPSERKQIRTIQNRNRMDRSKISQNGLRPLQDKLLAIEELKEPRNEKELKSFLGAIQYLSKYIENLSAQTDIMRQLFKNDTKWEWTEEHTKAFENLKQKITEIQCLAHYNSNYPNIITTDAGFASRFLCDTKKKYATNELNY